MLGAWCIPRIKQRKSRAAQDILFQALKTAFVPTYRDLEVRSISSFKSRMDLSAPNNELPIRINVSISGVLANAAIRQLFRKGHH